jgi:hypothetical protein
VPRYDIRGKRHLEINDNHPKTIITLGRIHGDSIEGIGVTSLADFLCAC